MWEKYMTKPLVDSGEWTRVDEVPTPWPCFSVAVADGVDVKDVNELFRRIIRPEAEAIVSEPEKAVSEIAEEYDLAPDDVKRWITTVKWCAKPMIPRDTLALVQDTLLDAQVLTAPVDIKSLVIPENTKFPPTLDDDSIGVDANFFCN
mmetsp:Transcript_6074/g.19813  ORF Transcript_6074/g.19813 Transcript_6074/m.19813 type:complete len:148 (-) Transcript_6074:264-707(-)